MPNETAIPADALSALLTAAELAQKLRVEESYVSWLRRRHGLPWIRVGGEPRFEWAAVSAWLTARAVSTPPANHATDPGGAHSRAAQEDTFHRHAVMLARYRGEESDLLEEALHEVRDPTDRQVLIAIAAAACALSAGDHYRIHSPLAEEGPSLADIRPGPATLSEDQSLWTRNAITELRARIQEDTQGLLGIQGRDIAAGAWRIVSSASAIATFVITTRARCDGWVGAAEPAAARERSDGARDRAASSRTARTRKR